MARLPNGAKAPKKKKPAPKKSAPKKAAYAAKMKHSATNESNAARNGKKPSSVAKAKPKKAMSAGALFKQQTKAMYKGINERAAKRTTANAEKTKARAKSKSKASSDWERGLEVRNWAQGQKKPWQK